MFFTKFKKLFSLPQVMEKQWSYLAMTEFCVVKFLLQKKKSILIAIKTKTWYGERETEDTKEKLVQNKDGFKKKRY